jgi:hypothetical protein
VYVIINVDYWHCLRRCWEQSSNKLHCDVPVFSSAMKIVNTACIFAITGIIISQWPSGAFTCNSESAVELSVETAVRDGNY